LHFATSSAFQDKFEAASRKGQFFKQALLPVSASIAVSNCRSSVRANAGKKTVNQKFPLVVKGTTKV